MEVIHTDEFEVWFLDLDAKDAKDVRFVVRLLEEKGLTLGSPYSTSIVGAPIALRELRCNKGHSPVRVFYAFDPRRKAVLLIGGDKANDKRFYERMTDKAVSIWHRYLEATKDE